MIDEAERTTLSVESSVRVDVLEAHASAAGRGAGVLEASVELAQPALQAGVTDWGNSLTQTA